MHQLGPSMRTLLYLQMRLIGINCVILMISGVLREEKEFKEKWRKLEPTQDKSKTLPPGVGTPEPSKRTGAFCLRASGRQPREAEATASWHLDVRHGWSPSPCAIWRENWSKSYKKRAKLVFRAFQTWEKELDARFWSIGRSINGDFVKDSSSISLHE